MKRNKTPLIGQASRKQEKKILDKLFSDSIRMRAVQRSGGCERCRSPKTYKQLDCAHCFTRKDLSTRWDEDNACGLCGGCHMYLDTHPREKENFFMLLLGDEKFRQLEIRANMHVGSKKVDVPLLILYYTEQISKLS